MGRRSTDIHICQHNLCSALAGTHNIFRGLRLVHRRRSMAFYVGGGILTLLA